jgi:hypothetical protein
MIPRPTQERNTSHRRQGAKTGPPGMHTKSLLKQFGWRVTLPTIFRKGETVCGCNRQSWQCNGVPNQPAGAVAGTAGCWLLARGSTALPRYIYRRRPARNGSRSRSGREAPREKRALRIFGRCAWANSLFSAMNTCTGTPPVAPSRQPPPPALLFIAYAYSFYLLFERFVYWRLRALHSSSVLLRRVYECIRVSGGRAASRAGASFAPYPYPIPHTRRRRIIQSVASSDDRMLIGSR